MSFFRLFSNISLHTSTFRQNVKEIDKGRPSGNCGRGLGAIRALWRAWQALKFFPAGVGKTISRDFCMRPYFIFIRTYDSCCFLHGAQLQTTFARSALEVQTTDASYSSNSSAESMLRPVGCNATRRAVLLTVSCIGPLDTSSRITAAAVCLVCCV